MLPTSAARSPLAQREQVLASQAERLNSVLSTSPLTWYITYQVCMLSYFLAAVLCDQQCLQDGIHCNFVPRCLQVDVANKRCQESGCTKHPSYGLLGGKAQYCAEHKSADMVCYRCPSLLIHYEHAALCDQQYLQNGIHCNCVLRCLQVNVVAKPCQEPGCTKQPSSGLPGGKAQFCVEHKSADMVCHPGRPLLGCTA